MRKTRQRLAIILSLGCLTVIVITVALVLSSERITGADAVKIEGDIQPPMPSTDQSPIVQENRAFLEGIRQEYAKLQSVIFDAKVNIQLWREGQAVTGQGTVKYRATGNLYRYEVELSDELVKAGLMRNVAVAWDGRQHFFYDQSIDTLSIQPVEERRNIAAIPNPFFLPVDFLASTDDSSCSGCMVMKVDGSPALLATFKVSKLLLNSAIDENEFRLLPGKDTKVVFAESYRSGK